jgi:hypothetical protein
MNIDCLKRYGILKGLYWHPVIQSRPKPRSCRTGLRGKTNAVPGTYILRCHIELIPQREGNFFASWAINAFSRKTGLVCISTWTKQLRWFHGVMCRKSVVKYNLQLLVTDFQFPTHFEDPGVDGRIILKWTFDRLDGGGGHGLHQSDPG